LKENIKEKVSPFPNLLFLPSRNASIFYQRENLVFILQLSPVSLAKKILFAAQESSHLYL